MAQTEGATWRRLELGGGRATGQATTRLELPAGGNSYADAQLDDYGPTPAHPGGLNFRWRPGVSLRLRARFSQEADRLRGTAGFGFWNAPLGDPTVRRPALPQATWFFFASAPSHMPFGPDPDGRGWFAATLDAGTGRALPMTPLAPALLLAMQSAALRGRLWPWLKDRLSIGSAIMTTSMTGWHDYRLDWTKGGCHFYVDGTPLLAAPSPRGPLGFVCWLDNQYMIVTPRGRLESGVVEMAETQWLEVAEINIARVDAL